MFVSLLSTLNDPRDSRAARPKRTEAPTNFNPRLRMLKLFGDRRLFYLRIVYYSGNIIQGNRRDIIGLQSFQPLIF
jgi:hypothetical protein